MSFFYHIKTMVFGLGLGLFSCQSLADSLTIHVIRSPFGINWSKPQKLAFSTLANQIGGSHTIGHAYVEVKCEGEDGIKPYESITGMTTEDNIEERQLLLKDKIGFGIFWHNFQGRFQKNEEIHEDLAKMSKEKRVRAIEFFITASTCRRLQKYTQDFEYQEYWRTYGLANRPLEKEGAGCTAYAVSFLQVAGIPLTDFEKHWSKTINIPMRYIGGPLNPGRRIDIFKLAFNPAAGKWAGHKSSGKEIFFWDPDAMYKWAKALVKGKTELTDATDLILTSAHGRVIKIDAQVIPTPENDIWK